MTTQTSTVETVEWGFIHPGWPVFGIGPHVETSWTGHDGWTTGPYTEDNVVSAAAGRGAIVKRTKTVTTEVSDWQIIDGD